MEPSQRIKSPTGSFKSRLGEKILSEQEKFESDMLDIKLAVKQTQELIERSWKPKLNQDNIKSEDPDRTKFNPIRAVVEEETPRTDEGAKIEAKMGELIKEKEQEIVELIIQRQSMEENLLQTRRQLDGSLAENSKIKAQLAQLAQANADQE